LLIFYQVLLNARLNWLAVNITFGELTVFIRYIVICWFTGGRRDFRLLLWRYYTIWRDVFVCFEQELWNWGL